MADFHDYRPLHPGMGQAVAERTYLRKKDDGEWETWGDVSHRVALGNSLLCTTKKAQEKEYEILQRHLANASLLLSGRHLQHGDETQPDRTMEVFTNCSTSASSFMLFYLLLNGSGVGRCYDDDMMMVNWDHAPVVRCVISHEHQDFDWSAHESLRDARHKYGSGKDVMWYEVPDSREGWAKALELWENAAFQKVHVDKMLILDFSKVRPKGDAIAGMQNRPSSGPVPLMNAFHKAATLKGAGLERWRQALYLDHYFAECVLVGGARRSARMSTKTWRDKSVVDFITVKRPIEYDGLKMEEILEMREENTPDGFLWSSNNSLTVDEDFWRLTNLKRNETGFSSDLAQHARRVLRVLTQASYADGTGEPGIINADKLVQKEEGWQALTQGDYIGSEKYQLDEETELYMSRLARKAKRKKYHMITNPCGEIALTVLGGYCTIADVVPFHADTLDDAEEAFRAAVRALIRVNTMDCLYKAEVTRTNRIGVGMTGVMEFAYKFFGYGFYDLIDEEKSQDFWLTLARFNRAIYDEAVSYSKKLKVTIPHTMTTIKPAGTTSKLFGLCEGWHLPSMKWYVRWVQFSDNDPLIAKYRAAGYPVRELKQYRGHVIVGFPTQPILSTIMPDEKLVTAAEATPEEQYQWLMLGEKYYIHGTDKEGNLITDRNIGNQISYTLKYSPELVEYKDFKDMLVKYQSQIRCCSVMPQSDVAAYEYQPEEPVTKAKYEEIAHAIRAELEEDIGREHVDCEGGACPIDFNELQKVAAA
jgi:adenosylcobalamin-dependent ribonucleoside-triphosphate reductase